MKGVDAKVLDRGPHEPESAGLSQDMAQGRGKALGTKGLLLRCLVSCWVCAGSGCEFPCCFPLPWLSLNSSEKGGESPFSASCEAVPMKAPRELQTTPIAVTRAVIVLHVGGYKEHRRL